MKTAWPYLAIALGVLIFFGGIVYDCLFAGIPYQDPTPELSANYAFHSNIASTIRWIGFWIFAIGLSWRILCSFIPGLEPETVD